MYTQNKSRLTDTESKPVVTTGEREAGGRGEDKLEV